MALHDFTCWTCNTRTNDVYVPASVGAMQAQLFCPTCDGRLSWIPQIGSIGLIPESTREVVQVLQPDGSHKAVSINSIADIRRIERESAQAYANGEGQPMRWRDYSQDQSNKDVALFADPSQRPDPAFVKRGVVKRATEVEAAAIGEYGPGVTDANTSPIGE